MTGTESCQSASTTNRETTSLKPSTQVAQAEADSIGQRTSSFLPQEIELIKDLL